MKNRSFGKFTGEMLEPQKMQAEDKGCRATKSLHVGGTPEMRGKTEIRGFSPSPIPKRTVTFFLDFAGKVSGNFVNS